MLRRRTGPWVGRERLLARITRNDRADLVVLHGPAGSGKSWLAREALRVGGMPGSEWKVVRGRIREVNGVSVDVSCLELAQDKFGQSVGLGADGPLFLDGAETAGDEWSRAGWMEFLDRYSGERRIYLASRERPRLPLFGWTLDGRMLELGPSDLALDAQECALFLEGLPGESCGEEEAEILRELTGGWLAGLHLVRGHLLSGRRASEELRTLAQKPPASVRSLVASLLEEFDPETAEFLREAAYLGSLDPELCAAALSRSDVRRILSQVALSATPLLEDAGAPVPRFRPLFARALSENVGSLQVHSIAARWCLARDRWTEAMDHALQSRDGDVLESLAERAILEIFRGSEFALLKERALRIPQEIAGSRPFLSLFLAWAFFHMGREQEGSVHLQAARSLALAEPDQPSSRIVLDHAAFLRSVLQRLEGRVDASVRSANGAAMRTSDMFLRASLLVQEGIGRFRLGELEPARQILCEAADLSERHGHRMAFFGSLYTLVEIHLLRGRCSSASAVLRRAEEFEASNRERSGPVSGYATIARGRWHLWRGEVGEAARCAELGLEQGRRCDNIRILHYGFHLRAQLEFLAGNPAEARRTLRLAAATALRTRMHWAVDADRIDCTDAFLSAGTESPASEWLAENIQRFSSPGEDRWAGARAALALLVRLGRSAEAARLAAAWSRFLSERDLAGWEAEAALWLAVAEESDGRRDPALSALERFFQLALPRTQKAPLLLLGGARRWLDSLVATMPLSPARAEFLGGSVPGAIPHRDPVPSEFLSDRETEVLRALCEGLPNREIGRILFVAESTVKSHVKNIFAKLQVGNRTQAVLKAEGLGLVSRGA